MGETPLLDISAGAEELNAQNREYLFNRGSVRFFFRVVSAHDVVLIGVIGVISVISVIVIVGVFGVVPVVGIVALPYQQWKKSPAGARMS